jgi:hypothetical protein
MHRNKQAQRRRWQIHLFHIVTLERENGLETVDSLCKKKYVMKNGFAQGLRNGGLRELPDQARIARPVSTVCRSARLQGLIGFDNRMSGSVAGCTHGR